MLFISKFSDLQVQYKNDYFLADLQMHDGKGDQSFLDCITQVKRLLGLLSAWKYNAPKQKQKA